MLIRQAHLHGSGSSILLFPNYNQFKCIARHCPQDDSLVAAAESVFASMCVTDPMQSGNPMVFVSHGLEEMAGHAASEMLGQNCKVSDRNGMGAA